MFACIYNLIQAENDVHLLAETGICRVGSLWRSQLDALFDGLALILLIGYSRDKGVGSRYRSCPCPRCPGGTSRNEHRSKRDTGKLCISLVTSWCIFISFYAVTGERSAYSDVDVVHGSRHQFLWTNTGRQGLRGIGKAELGLSLEVEDIVLVDWGPYLSGDGEGEGHWRDTRE